jgi:hypothetical protein
MAPHSKSSSIYELHSTPEDKAIKTKHAQLVENEYIIISYLKVNTYPTPEQIQSCRRSFQAQWRNTLEISGDQKASRHLSLQHVTSCNLLSYLFKPRRLSTFVGTLLSSLSPCPKQPASRPHEKTWPFLVSPTVYSSSHSIWIHSSLSPIFEPSRVGS